MISRVRLPLRIAVDGLVAEVEALPGADWVAHFNTDYYAGEWSGVALRARAGARLPLYPDPTADGDWEDTATLGRCPALAATLARFRCELQAVRLLALGPGARVREHRDYRLGYDAGELRIHVPLITSPQAEFFHDGERIDMAPGEAWYLDLNLPHRVANPSPSRRVHLVVDCLVNPWLDALLTEGARVMG